MFRNIKIEPNFSFGFTADPSEASEEYNFIYMVGEKQAEISDASEKTRKIDKEVFMAIWDEIGQLNFAQILQENEDDYGYDGYRLTIHIGSLMNELAVTLWLPSETRYEEKGCTESQKFVKLVSKLLALAKENGFNPSFGC